MRRVDERTEFPHVRRVPIPVALARKLVEVIRGLRRQLFHVDRRRLDQDALRLSGAEFFGEPSWLAAHAVFDQFAILAQDADLAVDLMDIDANMIHGWPPTPCGFDRVLPVWGDSTPPR